MEFYLLILFSFSIADVSSGDLCLPAVEQEAAYLALESINPDIRWRSLYSDDLCLSGPHGVVCDFFPIRTTTAAAGDFVLHITDPNFGFVSDFSSKPNCSPNATLRSLLSSSSFPFPRKLFFYNCFVDTRTPLQGHFWNLSSSIDEIIFINNPSLIGRLDGRIGNFPNLRRIIFSDTGISGDIPFEIGQLRSLERLVLSRNRLRGEISMSIGRCESLKILDLSGNRIDGGFPGEIGRLGELVKLDLNSNRISGPVPVEFARLKKLEFLDLSYNRLTGSVPIALGRW